MNTLKSHLFSLCFLALTVFSINQLSAQVTSERISMSQGSNSAMLLELPGADAKMVSKMWVDYVKKELDAKTKKDRKSEEYQSLNIELDGISVGSAVDMYAKVSERGNSSLLTVWIGSNDGWINPDDLPRRYVEAEKMLMRFGLKVSKAQIQIMVEQEEDKLKELEKELEKLGRDKKKYEQNIEKAKQEIAKNEDLIKQNKTAQEDKTKAIDEQRKQVELTRKKGDF